MTVDITPFQREWVNISEHFELEIQLSYVIDLGNRKLIIPVRLLGFGAKKGMLLVTDYDLICDVAEQIINLGYGFSCLSEPWSGPIDWETVEEMLQDWGAIS